MEVERLLEEKKALTNRLKVSGLSKKSISEAYLHLQGKMEQMFEEVEIYRHKISLLEKDTGKTKRPLAHPSKK